MASRIDTLDLRRAFGKFATGVTVVTAVLPDGRKLGLTANSFASVSLDPPLVSWNYRRASPHLQALMGCEHFLVHVLSAEQRDLSHRMSRPADDKFHGLRIEEGVGGAPRLQGSLATFECELWQTVEAGDHVIFIGKVLHYDHTDGQPLVFVNGQYAEPRKGAAMILVLRADGQLVLEQPQDFSRLHLEVDPAFGTVEAAQARLGPLADIASRDVAWIARDALFDLGHAAAADPEEPFDWGASAQAMLAKAARHGWVREQAPAIKSHIVWRA